MTEPHTLLADHGATVTLTPVEPALVAEASTSSRTIAGIVLPWEEPGDTSAGRLTAGPASVRIPTDLSRVKLVDYHQDPPRAIGYATVVEKRPEGLWAEFKVATGPEGDRALASAAEHIDDAFSVELSQLVTAGPRISDSFLSAVALLGVPAFANARVATVVAAQTPITEKGIPMTPEQRARLAELLAKSGRTPEEETEFQQLQSLAVAEVTAQPEQPAAPAPAPTQVAATLTVPGGLAQVPVQLQAGQHVGGATARPLRDLYAAMARVARGESRPELEAALANITQTSNPYVAGADQYAGQLWSGLDYTRRFVQLMQQGELTSYKGNGWAWGVAPIVQDYAGDKTAVPSNTPTTINTPWTAARLAGAHDIDRKFRDFGDTEFFDAYYTAMTMSYALQSDLKARAYIIAQATAGTAVTGGLLKAVATVISRVDAATNGAPADYVLVNDVDKLSLLGVTAQNVPAFLDMYNVDPGKFIGTSAVPAGTVIAGTKNALEFKELPGVPIRVETVDMANGGIDGGVFGYYATFLDFAGGIVKTTFA